MCQRVGPVYRRWRGVQGLAASVGDTRAARADKHDEREEELTRKS